MTNQMVLILGGIIFWDNKYSNWAMSCTRIFDKSPHRRCATRVCGVLNIGLPIHCKWKWTLMLQQFVLYRQAAKALINHCNSVHTWTQSYSVPRNRCRSGRGTPRPETALPWPPWQGLSWQQTWMETLGFWNVRSTRWRSCNRKRCTGGKERHSARERPNSRSCSEWRWDGSHHYRETSWGSERRWFS